MDMYFFDNQTLSQYLESGEKLQVFANKEYLTVTNMADISDTQYGVGIDTTGKSITFSYKEITQIKIGGILYTLDMLQKSFEAPEDKEVAPTEKGTEESPKPEDKPKEPTKSEKTESIDRVIKNVDPSSRYYGSSGPVQLIQEGMVTYKTYVDGRYSNLTIPLELSEPMVIITKL